MTLDVSNPYLRTKVLTASPEQLRLMLIEGCLRFMREGRDAIERKDYEGQFEALSSAKSIILELIGSMRHEVAPDLCARLEGLYSFMFRSLVEAGFKRDAAKIDEVINLLDYERETWVVLMDKIAAERGESAPVQSADGPSSSGQPHQPLSIEG